MGNHDRGERERSRDDAVRRRAFVGQVEEAAKDVEGILDAEGDADEMKVHVKRPDGNWTLNLGNLYHDLADTGPEQRSRRIRAFLEQFDAFPELPDDAASALGLALPVIRRAQFHGEQSLREPGDRVARAPWHGCVARGVMIQFEEVGAYPAAKHLELWGLSFDDLYAAAIENLARITDAAQVVFDEQSAYPVLYVNAVDSHLSDRLLLPGFLASFRGEVNGTPIAIVPERDMLIVSGDGDEEAIARMIDKARRESEASPRWITASVFTLDDDDNVVPLELDAEHPLYDELLQNRLFDAMNAYQQQIAELQSANVQGVLGQFDILNHGVLGPISIALWAVETEALLPRADYLLMSGVARDRRSGDWMLLVKWSDAIALGGAALTPAPGYFPERVRACPPDRATFARLVGASIPFAPDAPGRGAALASYVPDAVELIAKTTQWREESKKRDPDGMQRIRLLEGYLLGWAIERNLVTPEFEEKHASAVVSFRLGQCDPMALHAACGGDLRELRLPDSVMTALEEMEQSPTFSFDLARALDGRYEHTPQKFERMKAFYDAAVARVVERA